MRLVVDAGGPVSGALSAEDDRGIVEGRLRRHWKRRNGELRDALVMGLPPEPAGGAGTGLIRT